MSRRFFRVIPAFFFLFAFPIIASASESGESFPTSRVWQVRFDQPEITPQPLNFSVQAAAQEPATQARPTAYVYSDGYNTRRKIHMIASYATIPLFVGQYVAGQKLYDGDGSESAKSWHGALAGGVAALFAVNTVTGVWNLMEARHDPNGRTRRLIHGLLMLGADAGFVATGMMAPDDDEGGGSSASAHRTVAITSMGVAAASYVYMLVTR